MKILEAKRLGHEIAAEDLGTKMFASPGEFAKPVKDVVMCGGTDRAFQQATAVEADAGCLGDCRHALHA